MPIDSKFNCLVQASYMSCNRRSRARIVARNLSYAPGLQDGRSNWEPIDLKKYDGLSGRSPVPFRIQMIPRDHHVVEVLEM
jgi:hypothetical protein